MLLSDLNRVKAGFLKLVDFFKDPRNPVRVPYYLLSGKTKVPEVNLEPGIELNFCLTVDVEHDFGIPSTLGELSTVEKGLKNLLQFFDERNVEGTFFVSHPILEEFTGSVEELSSSHEVGVHGFNHECWSEPKWWLVDDRILDWEQKEKLLDKMISSVEKVTNEKPKSFRAPYMTADMETLQLLETKGFGIDSSAPSHYGVFPRPFRPDNLFLLEIPVSASPVPEFTARPIPHINFNFLITKLLSSRGLNWCTDFVEKVIKFQIYEDISPYLVMVLHQWEFVELDATPTKSSEYAKEDNLELLGKMLGRLEEEFEVCYFSLERLYERINPTIT